ncbi:MAG: hypothetical protein ACRCZF_18950, partial [Gemmataceae bacterium]
IAYFVLAVIIPLVVFGTRTDAVSTWKTNGLIFSALAGAMGAAGAICVVFASKAATDVALEQKINPATYRALIAPCIFALAPAINTLVSLCWHPKPGDPFHFGFEVPGWKLPVGILLVACGSYFVLSSKEDMEIAKGGPKPPPAAPVTAPAPSAAQP